MISRFVDLKDSRCDAHSFFCGFHETSVVAAIDEITMQHRMFIDEFSFLAEARGLRTPSRHSLYCMYLS